MPHTVITLQPDSWTFIVASGVSKFTAQPKPDKKRPGAPNKMRFQFGASAPADANNDGIAAGQEMAITRDHGEGNLYGKGRGHVELAT